MSSEKTREDRCRRRLARRGLQLTKTPSRSWLRAYYGPGYMVCKNNTVVYGCYHREYDLTLEEVEDYVEAIDAPASA